MEDKCPGQLRDICNEQSPSIMQALNDTPAPPWQQGQLFELEEQKHQLSSTDKHRLLTGVLQTQPLLVPNSLALP